MSVRRSQEVGKETPTSSSIRATALLRLWSTIMEEMRKPDVYDRNSELRIVNDDGLEILAGILTYRRPARANNGLPLCPWHFGKCQKKV